MSLRSGQPRLFMSRHVRGVSTRTSQAATVSVQTKKYFCALRWGGRSSDAGRVTVSLPLLVEFVELSAMVAAGHGGGRQERKEEGAARRGACDGGVYTRLASSWAATWRCYSRRAPIIIEPDSVAPSSVYLLSVSPHSPSSSDSHLLTVDATGLRRCARRRTDMQMTVVRCPRVAGAHPNQAICM